MKNQTIISLSINVSEFYSMSPMTVTGINVDQKKLHLIYENWPEHFREASRINVKIDHSPDFYTSVIMCGMGASGTCCDILSDVMNHSSNLHPAVVKGQQMPAWINKHSLVIVNSVSGNTAETLNMMREAAKHGAEMVCISSGGELKDLASALGHKHISIPNLNVPRASLPYLLVPGLKLISPFMKETIYEEIEIIPTNLSLIAKEISVRVSSNKSERLASFLQGGMAFCFTSPLLISAGTRFKNSLNENAKVHCMRESVLEASHNEIVPFTYYNVLAPKVLLLRWNYDSPIVNERFEKIKALFTNIGQSFTEISAYEHSLINAIISSIYILDYSTIYMAISRGIDPSPTPAIDILKQMR